MVLSMVNKNFTITRGNSLQFRVNFVDAEALPDEINLILKDKSTDIAEVLKLDLNDGITKVEDKDSYDFYIAATDTEDLQLLNYIYQINAIYGSDVDTIVEGKLIITPEL